MIKSLLLALLLSATMFAENVSLTWNKNPEADIASYTLVYAKNVDLLNKINDPSTTKVVTNAAVNVVTVDLAPGTYYFAVFATNDEGTSGPHSSSISHRVMKPAPGAVSGVKVVTLPIQGSVNKKEWKNIALFSPPYDKNGNSKWDFYRVGKSAL